MAKPLVSDELWAIVAPLLPPEPPKPKGGRPRVPDRACLTGIIFVLKSRIPWELLPQEMRCGSGMTCWRRLRDWHTSTASGTRSIASCSIASAKPARSIGRRASLDCASVPAKKGATASAEPHRPRQTRHQTAHSHRARRYPVRPSPDRSQPPRVGGLRAADRCHTPHQAAQRPPPQAPRQDARRQGLRHPALPPCPAPAPHPRPHRPQSIDSSQRLGRHRWVVVRTFSWLNQFRRLPIRYERRADIHHAFLTLGCALICFRGRDWRAELAGGG